MSHLARLTLLLVAGPAAVAVFAAFELRHPGPLIAVAGTWGVFATCVFAIAAWEKIQLARSETRLQALRSRRSSRTR